MATRDFRSQQLRTTQIVASGSQTTSQPSLLIYSSSAATNDQGSMHADLLSGAGEDAWMFISGSTQAPDGHQVLFGGNIVVSGTLSGSVFGGLPDQSVSIISDDNLTFIIDSDGGNTSNFIFKAGTTEIAVLDEDGDLQIDGDIKISGGNILEGGAGKVPISIDSSANVMIGGGTRSGTANNGLNHTATSGLYVPEYITHTGDLDTTIRFEDNKISLDTGTGGSVEVNPLKNNVDFKVSGDHSTSVYTVHSVASQDAIKFLDTSTNDIAQNNVGFHVSGLPGNHKAWVDDPTNSTGLLKRGTALFRGDVVISGTLYAEKQILEVDMVQSGSNLILSSSLHFKNSGPGAGTNFVVPANDGAVFVSTGSLFAKLGDGSGNTTEIKIGQNYLPGNGLTATSLDPNTTFHMSIAALTGSPLAADNLVGGDLLAIADVSEADDRTRRMTVDDFVLDLARRGLRSAIDISDSPGFIADDGIVAHLTGSEFSGTVGITGSQAGSLGVMAGTGAAQLVVSYDTATSASIGVDSAGNMVLATDLTDSDIVFKVDDNNTEFTALTIDGSDKGSAKFTPAAGGGLSVRAGTEDANINLAGGEFVLEKASNTPSTAPMISLKKSKGTVGGETTIDNNDTLGYLLWYGYDDDGSSQSAGIIGKADGIHGATSTDSPGKLIFATAPDGSSTLSERMIIRQDGKVGVATVDPQNRFAVSGSIESHNGDIIINRNEVGSPTETDTVVRFQYASQDVWVTGIDDNDSDKFKINNGVLANPSKFELDSSGNVEIAGDLTVAGNDIKSSTATAITLDSANATVAGTLSVAGGTGTIIGANDAVAKLELKADNSDDAGDDWTITSNVDQTFAIGNDIASAGTTVSHVTITPHATVTDSVVDVKGKLKVGGNIIQNSEGTTTITMDATEKVTLAGDLKVSGNNIVDSGGSSGITFDGSGNTAIDGELSVSQNISHTGDTDTFVQFTTDTVRIQAGALPGHASFDGVSSQPLTILNASHQNIDFRVQAASVGGRVKSAIFVDASEHQIAILSGSTAATSGNSYDESSGKDVGFYVSGSTGTLYGLGATSRGVAVFGGDVVISGSIYNSAHSRINLLSVIENGTFSTTPQVQGTNTLAIGNDARAGNIGGSAVAGAFAIGNKTIASGARSIALGSATGNNTASGVSAAAIGGESVTAAGDYSAVLGGQNNTASGDYSAIIGRENSIADVTDSIAIGKSLSVTNPNTIAIGNNTNNAAIEFKGTVSAAADVTLEYGADLIVPDYIKHLGDTNTRIAFDTDDVRLTAGGEDNVKVTTTQVLILSGGHSSSTDQSTGLDVAMFVSGTLSSRGTTIRGTTLFGGDVHISGSLSGPSEYTLTDNTVRVFRDGSVMKFSDGANTGKTLSELASLPASTDFFVGVHGDASNDSKLKATGSVAFSGNDDNYVDGLQAKGVGQDVFVFFSGSIGSKAGWGASGANQFKTDGRAVTLFGGDTHFSGSTGFTDVLASNDVRANGSLVAGGNIIKNSGGNKTIKFGSANPFSFFAPDSLMAAGTPTTLIDIRKDDNTVFASGVDGNAYENYNIALRNHSTTTNAFSGIAFDVADAEDVDTIGASIAALRDSTASADDHDTNLVIATNDGGDDGLTERMRITHDGKVGIGTNNPSTALHISATDSVVIPVGTTAQRGTATQGGIRYNTTTSTFEGYSGATWGSLGGTQDVDQDTYVRAETAAGTDNDDLVFFTGGSQRMSIDHLGVTAVTGSFQTSADTSVGGDLTIVGGDIVFGNGQAASVDIVDTAHDVVGKDLTIGAGSTTAGTTDNIAGGNLTFRAGQGKGNGFGGEIIFQTATSTPGIPGSGSNLNALTEKMRLTEIGKLGIGTNDPSGKLHVKGDFIVEDSDSGDILARIYENGDDGILDIYQNDAITARIHGNGNSYFTGGSVGIGTSSPGTLLQLEAADAYVTLKNSTDEHTDGGAESRIIFEDHGNNSLALVEGSHDGPSDDTKGKIKFRVNTGSGLEDGLTIGSDKAAHFGGALVVWGNDIAGGGTDADLTVRSEGNIIFKVDTDNAEEEIFQFKNGAGGEVVSINEAGDMTLSGDLTVNGGGLTVDTNVLVVDGQNNRVGIGTASPDMPLVVSPTAKTTAAGVTPQESSVTINEPNLTVGGGNSVQEAQTLHISGVPTEATGLYTFANASGQIPKNLGIKVDGDLRIQNMWLDGDPNTVEEVSTVVFDGTAGSSFTSAAATRDENAVVANNYYQNSVQLLKANLNGLTTSHYAISLAGKSGHTSVVTACASAATFTQTDFSNFTGNDVHSDGEWSPVGGSGYQGDTAFIHTLGNDPYIFSDTQYASFVVPLTQTANEENDKIHLFFKMKVAAGMGSSDMVRVAAKSANTDNPSTNSINVSFTFAVDAGDGTWDAVTPHGSVYFKPKATGINGALNLVDNEWTWVRVTIADGSGVLADVSHVYFDLYNDPDVNVFFSNFCNSIEESAEESGIDGSNSGGIGKIFAAWDFDDPKFKGNIGASWRELEFLVARGDNASFKHPTNVNGAMANPPDSAKFVVQLSTNGGSTWANIGTKMRKATGSGSPVTGAFIGGSSNWTELVNNGYALLSELNTGVWTRLRIDAPLDSYMDLSNARWRICLAGSSVDKEGIAIGYISTVNAYRRGVHSFGATDSIVHKTYSGKTDIVHTARSYKNESVFIDWLKYDASVESIIVPALEVKCNANTATGGTNTPGLKITDSDSADHWDIFVGSAGDSHLNVRPSGTTTNGGYFQSNSNVFGFTFTGQHRNRPVDGLEVADFTDKIGYIVVSNGLYDNIISDNKPQINQSLPCVELSSARNQKSVFGVISEVEDDSDTRTWNQGMWVSTWEKESGDDRMHINSLGEGAIWVTNVGGDLENGDYITTSEIPGLGMKQDDDLLHNYTVAKITQDCSFDLNSSIYECVEFEHEGQTYRRAFVGCTYHCG